MLTPERFADGWIAHDGGECPVPLDSKPGIIIRGFSRSHLCQLSGEGDEALQFEWRHNPRTPAADIIAYRPEPSHD